MNLFRIFVFFLWGTAILTVAGSSLYGEAADTKASPAANEQSPTATPNKKRIYVGMPAEELRAIIGKPEKIISVPPKTDKDEKSEVWEYRKLIKTQVENVRVGETPITVKRLNPDGTSSDVVLTSEQVTKYRRTETYKVARFLIVNGKYTATTQFEEQKQSYD